MIFYGVFFPMGIGLCYWPPIISAWEWFPERKGLITGLVLGAYGLGAFIYSFVTNAIANPQNISPFIPNDGTGTTDKLFPIDVANNVPFMFRICVICWFCQCLFGLLTITRNPEYLNKYKKKTE